MPEGHGVARSQGNRDLAYVKGLLMRGLTEALQEEIAAFAYECDDAAFGSDEVDEMVARVLSDIGRAYGLRREAQ
jgi:hypothetical protein